MNKSLLYSCCFVVLSLLLHAQLLHAQEHTAFVNGTVIDSSTKNPLPGVVVSIRNTEGKMTSGAVSDSRGRFLLRNVPVGNHTLLFRMIGYDTLRAVLRVRNEDDTLHLGTIHITQGSILAKDVVIEAQAIRMEVKGDTVEYNASQFKTDKNAAAEDMLKKMPGIDIQNGQVKAQGEQVKRVLVDGKPFFGDDPTTTLKNLPSEVIDRVQVFDQMSDQAQFTRFDDGERNKTLNIVTRADRRNGQFGKLYAGYGSEDRYTAGGNINYFGGERKISLIGLSNNINQQNFSIQDILGAMGGGGGMMGRMMGNSMRLFGTGGNRGGGRTYGGGDVSNFLVQQNDGITASHGLGINYTDSWGKVFSLTGSYFVNRTNNDAIQQTNRESYLSEGQTQYTSTGSDNGTINLNHRINLRADYSIDSMSSILLSPRFTWQSNDKTNGTSVRNTLGDTLQNTSLNNNTNNSNAYNIGSDLLYRLRFVTEGRTFSASLNTNVRNNSGTQNTSADNYFYANSLLRDSSLVLQQTPNTGKQLSYGANLSYTEPLAKSHLLQISYNFSNTHSESDKQAYAQDSVSKQMTVLLPRLSNVSTSDYTTHRPGLNYRFTLETAKDTVTPQQQSAVTMMMFGTTRPPGGGPGGGGMGGMGGVGAWVFNLGVDYQIARLAVDQSFPLAFNSARSFYNILPSLSVTTRPSMVSNLRFNYRTSTNQPSIQQLQNILDNSNPLQLSVGNPGLEQEFTHNLSANFGSFNIQSASGFFTMVNLSLTRNKIINSTFLATRDTVLQLPEQGSVRLGSGAQLSRYENRNGYMNGNYFIVYSFPWEPAKGLKLNLNTNANVSYTRDISLINDIENVGNTWVATPSLGLSSNISENTDFTLSGSSAFNTVRNSVRSELNQTYFTHTVRTSATFILRDSSSSFWDGWLCTGDFSYIVTSGLASGYNQSVPLLNFGIGKRLFDGNGEIKLSVFDALNQNNSITRNVGSGYIEDVQTNVLRRYLLLSFTYNLRIWNTSGSSGK